jgi:hypothetical protein
MEGSGRGVIYSPIPEVSWWVGGMHHKDNSRVSRAPDRRSKLEPLITKQDW